MGAKSAETKAANKEKEKQEAQRLIAEGEGRRSRSTYALASTDFVNVASQKYLQ
jgi:hypothetical protein